MKIFSYFDALTSIDQTNERKLICLWIENIKANGYEPVVLNSHHAMKNPLFEEYHAKVSKFPSVNPEGYEVCNFIRWLAVGEAAKDEDTAVMMDYDCCLYGWAPRLNNGRKLMLHQRAVPCLVTGTPSRFIMQCRKFMLYRVKPNDLQGDKPHISDMMIINSYLEDDFSTFDHWPCVKSYGDPDWEKAPVVHYSNAAMTPGHQPRHEHIRKLRDWV